MAWEIWKLQSDHSGRILEVERFGEDGEAARARFEEIEKAREAGVWELRNGGVYVALYAMKRPLEVG